MPEPVTLEDPREKSRGAWLARSPALAELRLVGIGRGEELAPVDAGVVTHAENRVEIERSRVLAVRTWMLYGTDLCPSD